MYDRRVSWLYQLVDTFLSIVRVLAHSRFIKPTPKFQRTKRQVIIMGNGPSLVETLEENRQYLSDFDLIVVNFMGLSQVFEKYKPKIYILSDPAFWFQGYTEEVNRLAAELYNLISAKVDWKLTLYIPYQAYKIKEVREIAIINNNITLSYYNKTKFEGCRFLRYYVYKMQWGMPRAQNVLISALMLSIHSEYDEVYLIGAENDFIKNIWVDDNNYLRTGLKHFYDDGKSDGSDVRKSQRLFEQLASLYYTFKSYWDIADYAARTNTVVFNATPTSYIDAFARRKISQTKD